MANSSTAGNKKGNLKKLKILIGATWIFSLINYGKGQLVVGENPKKDLEKTTYSRDLYGKLATSMVPVRERQMTAICHYEVIADVNNHRIPDRIDKVLCKKESCKCASQSDFRCTQLYTHLNVTYFAEGMKPFVDFELVTVEYACVCSKAPKGSHINLLEPVIV